jgi:hypothetical protein
MLCQLAPVLLHGQGRGRRCRRPGQLLGAPRRKYRNVDWESSTVPNIIIR